MLFDLGSGKRKTVVRVVYGTLAVVFLIGFVGFGVGVGGGPGGIFDALGLGNGNSSGGSVSSQFDSQIAGAQKRLAADPKDEQALLRLAKYQYEKGQAELSVDSSGNPVVTDTSQTDLGKSIDAWERYLKVAGSHPNVAVAQQVVAAYALLNDPAGAARTQAFIAADQPSANSYGTLAVYRYANFDFTDGEAAAKKAISEASKSDKKSIQQTLDQYKTQYEKLQKQQKNAPSGATTNPLTTPSGGALPTP